MPTSTRACARERACACKHVCSCKCAILRAGPSADGHRFAWRAAGRQVAVGGGLTAAGGVWRVVGRVAVGQSGR